MNKSFSSIDDVKKCPSSNKGSKHYNKTTLSLSIAGILFAQPSLVMAANGADGTDAYTIQSGSVTLSSDYTGGNGFNGADAPGSGSQSSPNASPGGNGGAGGRAVAVSGSTQSVTNSYDLTGGNGGSGGMGSNGEDIDPTNPNPTGYSGGNGGAGGDGGAALSKTGGYTTFSNSGNILGGNGGDGGNGGNSGGTGGAGGNAGIAGDGGAGISLISGTLTVNNSGDISGGNGGTGGYGANGTAGSGGNGGAGINVSGGKLYLDNSVSISGGSGGYDGVGTLIGTDGSAISISGTDSYAEIKNRPSGSISASADAIKVDAASVDIINYGVISNTGTGSSAISVTNGGNISIINTGFINTTSGSPDINVASGGTVSRFDNLQGGTLTQPTADMNTILTTQTVQSGNVLTQMPVTYNGRLPNNYNIIIYSNTKYGQIQFSNSSGAMTFGISTLSEPSSISSFSESNGVFTISDVVSGISDKSSFNNTTSGGWDAWGLYENYAWKLQQQSGSNTWDLLFRKLPSLQGTLTALEQNAAALGSVYALQESLLNFNLQRDCNTFDQDGICALVQYGRSDFSGGDDNTSNNGSLVVAYQTSANSHIGAYLDKTLSISNSSGVDIRNGTPAFGAFAVWQQNTDNTGWRVRLSAGRSNKDVDITRQTFGDSEAGQGKTGLTAYGASLTASNALPFNSITVSPYFGLRYSKVSSDTYTEKDINNMLAPLTYAELNATASTALLGVKLTAPITATTRFNAKLGIEHDMHRDNGAYQASSVYLPNLNDIKMTQQNQNRPTASVGMQYQAGKATLLGINLSWTQTAYATEHYTNASVYFSQGF
jgi:hypothetical protein